ncbi:MAG: LytTR family transcriptional regulator DNA-binding domain-containing protein [Fibrobacter sp.]|uniref:LytR/AlgR family response regulator transcription factor n=1 Tax=Fibrobacter sp. TaxID=35828 RepID=UPI0025B95447|nr:LytTR family transcriptional regulator DNA-binding domain-containing protein [Fibrobacter sp.]MBR4783862.1 LytTR family transcriptional regulator DNA-binding domain-containing protein [Fibrobacter sp.]
MKARTLIIDDEPLARMRIRSLLEKYPDDLDIIDEASSGSQAISKINELAPDVVFLDIQMPDMDAFEVLKNVDEDIMPLIVFTTAYENFALRAYEENTVDYLLKPVDPERLESTMEKLRKRLPDIEATNQMPADFSWEKFRSLMAMGDQYLQRVQVKIGDRILLVSVDEIIRFHSEEKYTTIYTPTNQYVIDTPLVDLEKKLDPRQFVRVHRAHLVAIDYIAEIRKTDSSRLNVILRDKDHTQILVSRNFVKTVRNL